MTARGKKLAVDLERSLTWYNRQWSVDNSSLAPVSGSSNYTWFQVNLPKSGLRASIWAIDYTETGEEHRVAKFKYKDGARLVLLYDLVPYPKSVYVSPRTGLSYATKYMLNFPGRGSVKVTTIRADQEVLERDYGIWEGFAEFKMNVLCFREKGFGVLETIPALET